MIRVFGRREKNKEEDNKKPDYDYVRYDYALTDKEILLCAQIIDQFERGEIDFITLKEQFLGYDISLEAVLHDVSGRMMTVVQAEEREKRIAEHNFRPEDIKYYLLNSENFKNVVFLMDRKAIELLAESGSRKYQEALIGILKTQLKYSMNTTLESTAQRAMWSRRITELEKDMEKNSNNTLFR